jgi:alcohol dehydrogenase class IV
MSVFPGRFSVARLPRIVFGAGTLNEVPRIAATFGRNALVVTGARSLRVSGSWTTLADGLRGAGVAFEVMTVEGEPSPELVDRGVQEFFDKGIGVVVGIGGGSVLDAAKAVAGLLPRGNSVFDHLEGVGRNVPYPGPSVPFVAVPTTAGTGSEATKNAVLSLRGAGGFKKSFRDDALVARVAVVDPELLASCPPELIAANGMDAFTQLLESLVSARANPFTDALALSGIEAVRDGFFAAWGGGGSAEAAQGRARMAYASLLSGITLAQAGLGSVHGLASPLGAFFPIPHGVACGTLVAAATETNIRALRARAANHPALEKYARVGGLLAEVPARDDDEARDELVRTLYAWTACLKLPALGAYRVGADDIGRIVAGARGTSMQTNPVDLSDAEVADIVRARL